MPKKKDADLGLGAPIEFYNGEITLRFSERDHIYYRIDDGQPVPIEGVTQTCGIIDKSLYLIPWACKMMAEKLLRTMPRHAAEQIAKDVDVQMQILMEQQKGENEKLTLCKQ